MLTVNESAAAVKAMSRKMPANEALPRLRPAATSVRMSAMTSTPYQASDDSQAFTWASRALR